ncbi:HAUS augmin-like complex subunit 8 isoform X2 [Oncorhynchus mykiss]|uniref:HAUS augmin-like complex subunit 8 isoform X2 n=1 Tax=Oncorhynchus mykiss TaxID=8022 RepID=UPI0018783514|nr:HAUS augmin-like complex subunit 8 isoform X2 [Oncorhynchus mykiss]
MLENLWVPRMERMGRQKQKKDLSKAVIENSKSNNSGTGNPSKAKGNSSGNGNKTKSGGTIVKSRYLQPVEKAPLTKNNSLTNESTLVPPRPASPKPVSVKPRVGSPARRSMAPQSLRNPTPMMSSVLEPSQLGRSILQSTILDGHCLRPDFDVSAIKDKTVLPNAAVEPERNDEHEKRLLEMQTFLLAYLTAKMENNSQKLKAEAEGRIIAVMEEEELLRKEVHEKKRQYLLLEKNKQLDDLLDLQSDILYFQITALTPVADAAKQFTQEYKSFATAVDTTRHELPVKNFYIDGDRMTFLDKATASLKESEEVLLQCTQGAHHGNEKSAECLRGMKTAAQDISKQLSGGFSELLELSSLVSRQTVQIQQALEEEQLGLTRVQELYCPKQ